MIDGGIIEAVVQVGAQETHYLRCGRGERVVVVVTGDAAERLRLIRHYAAGCRVIAPVPPAPGGATSVDEGGAADARHDGLRRAAGSARADDLQAAADWIRGVIDGLGLDRPAVVLADDVAWLADRLAEGAAEAFEVLETVPARSS